MSTPSIITEYAFSGSLCRIHEFKTLYGTRCCLTIFSLSDYKHLHFPHDEYKCLIRKLYMLLSTQAILPSASNSNVQFTIKQLPDDEDFKIKFGIHSLTIAPVTAFGLVKTTPFYPVNKKLITCDFKWDICTCKKCPVFKRLIDYEIAAAVRFSYRRPENVILFQKIK